MFGENKAGTKCVLVVELVTRIQFEAVGKNVSINPRSDAVEDEIADIVGPKKDCAVAIKD